MLVEQIELNRIDASQRLEALRRAELGQYLTPAPTAQLMASMFQKREPVLRLLDPGAGVGSLTAAFVAEICAWRQPPKSVYATAFEVDTELGNYLAATLDQCRAACATAGICFEYELVHGDFIEAAVAALRGEMFQTPRRYNRVIMNPPYRKIGADSSEWRALRAAGVETSNLYAGFVSLALRLLEPGGEMVAITPRSFCNGSYFKRFRTELLDALAIRRLHVFDSRQVAFKDDAVLQENVILHGEKSSWDAKPVMISSSTGPDDDEMLAREVARDAIVHPGDPQRCIHIVPDEIGSAVANRMTALPASLVDLGIEVSTGRVVDFRAKKFLRDAPGTRTVPLIYPCNFEGGFIRWPRVGRKPQAMATLPGVDELLLPSQTYVLVKRFTSKEEKRRIVAAVFDPKRVEGARVGFENHTNVYHHNGRGLSAKLAKGLAAFLNSSLVDLYFRQFSGHTQVNATDLRNLRYPQKTQLSQIGAAIGDKFPDQRRIDQLVEEALALPDQVGIPNPVEAKRKLDEALAILKALGLPRAQQNERSALTLLALAGLKPLSSWSGASSPLVGITPMMEFFREHYGKAYAPNSRETVRRQTVHQFLQAAFVVINPDKPDRPTNSGQTVYQIEPELLDLLRVWGTPAWEGSLARYLALAGTLKVTYAQERAARRIPVEVAPGKVLTLSPGGQNVLIERIIEEFCGYFTPGGQIAYVGDTDEKFAYLDADLLTRLGVRIDAHGKMPDVVVYYEEKRWLVLIEAVTSHGPISPKRMSELKQLFGGSMAGLVFVTAFLDRQSMNRYSPEIAWETEVWLAESPTHLIHFNGERFLGPYQDAPI